MLSTFCSIHGRFDNYTSPNNLLVYDENIIIMPVSYTHLDVYKRQPLYFVEKRWHSTREQKHNNIILLLLFDLTVIPLGVGLL